MHPDEKAEAKLVNALRGLISDTNSNVDDAELRRFLRARNHDIGKAEEMLRNCLEWRKSVKFDEALTWTVNEKIMQSFPFFFDGKAANSDIVFYFPVGRWEVRKFIDSGYKNDMQLLIHYTMAKSMRLIDESASEQFVIIIDLAELSYWKVAHYETMQMVLQVFREYENNFPERLYSAFIINAPWVLNVIFPLIRPLITGRTMQKVQIFDSKADKYFPAILDVVPLNGLPSGFQDYNQEIVQTHIST